MNLDQIAHAEEEAAIGAAIAAEYTAIDEAIEAQQKTDEIEKEAAIAAWHASA